MGQGGGKLLAKHPSTPLSSAAKAGPNLSRACFPRLSPQPCCGRSNLSPGRSNSSPVGSSSILPMLLRSLELPFMGELGENLGGEVTLASFRTVISTQLSV